MTGDFVKGSVFDPALTVTQPTTNYVVTTGGADSCYIPLYPQPSYPVYPTTIVNWPSYPVMHPHCCPVCEGKETVPAGFYRDMAEDKGPQECRACKGKGLVYTP